MQQRIIGEMLQPRGLRLLQDCDRCFVADKDPCGSNVSLIIPLLVCVCSTTTQVHVCVFESCANGAVRCRVYAVCVRVLSSWNEWPCVCLLPFTAPTTPRTSSFPLSYPFLPLLPLSTSAPQGASGQSLSTPLLFTAVSFPSKQALIPGTLKPQPSSPRL